MRTLLLSLALGWLVADVAIAGEACQTPAACTEVQTCGSSDHCGRCGCCCPCEKHCRLVCDTKEVKKTVWVCHCEDFCAPLPGCCLKGCCGCESCNAGEARVAEPTCCNGCGGKCNPCASEENKCLVPPRCGKVRENVSGEKGSHLPGAVLQVRRRLLLPAMRHGGMRRRRARPPLQSRRFLLRHRRPHTTRCPRRRSRPIPHQCYDYLCYSPPILEASYCPQSPANRRALGVAERPRAAGLTVDQGLFHPLVQCLELPQQFLVPSIQIHQQVELRCLGIHLPLPIGRPVAWKSATFGKGNAASASWVICYGCDGYATGGDSIGLPAQPCGTINCDGTRKSRGGLVASVRIGR